MKVHRFDSDAFGEVYRKAGLDVGSNRLRETSVGFIPSLEVRFPQHHRTSTSYCILSASQAPRAFPSRVHGTGCNALTSFVDFIASKPVVVVRGALLSYTTSFSGGLIRCRNLPSANLSALPCIVLLVQAFTASQDASLDPRERIVRQQSPLSGPPSSFLVMEFREKG